MAKIKDDKTSLLFLKQLLELLNQLKTTSYSFQTVSTPRILSSTSSNTASNQNKYKNAKVQNQSMSQGHGKRSKYHVQVRDKFKFRHLDHSEDESI